jgi:PAS domain S-box-containing protein
MNEGRGTEREARILVIAAEAPLRHAISHLLGEAGYQVLEAATGTLGLRLASEAGPDLILLDFMLPDMDGLQVCRRIKADTESVGTFVVLLSDTAVDSGDLAQGLKETVEDFIVRPISNRELLARVRAMLRLRRAEEVRRAQMQELRERVKELNCLYRISRLTEHTGLFLPEILQRAVELIPPAWRYPEIACACIVLADQAFHTEGFQETAWKQGCDLRVLGKPVGRVEVHYLAERPEVDDGPFLKEERSLLNAIAECLGRIVERIRAEQALRESEERNIGDRKRAEEMLRWYQVMLASVSDPISFVDREYRYRFVNDAYARYAKRPREEILGLSIAELLGTEAFEGLVKPHFDRCLAGDEVHYQAWFEVPAEPPKYMHVSSCPMFDENQAVVGGVVTARDLSERRLAEEALERERDLVARIMDTSPVGIIVFDRAGQITLANARVQRVAELLGMPDLMGCAYNHPAWRLMTLDGDPLPDESLPFARVVNSRQPVADILYAVDLPDGQRFYLSSSAAPLLDRSGQIDGVIVTTEDVTTRVQAEAQLRESEKRYRQLLEALQEGLWIIDVDAYTTFVNPHMAKMLGYSVEEMAGKHLFSFMDEQGIEICKRNLERRRQGVREQHDFELLRKDGSRFYVSMATSPIYDEQGNYTGAIAGVQDISDRVNAMERLRASEERYRELVEKVSDVIYALSPEGVITYVSPAIEPLLGFSRDQVTGRPFAEFILPEDLKRAEANFQKLASGQRLGPNEYRVVGVTGEVHWILLSNQPVFDGDRVTEIRGVLTDLTERVKAEERREEAAAVAERERLARDLHDAVTQSLFSVSAIAEALPSVWERDQAAARRGLEELRQLTQGTLAEMRALLLELRPAALTEQRLDVLLHQLSEAMAGRTRVPVKTQITGACSLPTEVRIALYRIAQEALNNITKHAMASGAAVNLDCQPGHARLCIRDDGRGFDPEAIPPGRLGVNIMRERAQAIGALLRIESEPDHGTSVLVEWQGVQEGKDDGGTRSNSRDGR